MQVDTLPNGRQLTYGSYKDCSRPLRRCLKQLGSGSIEGGITAIKTDNKALEEISALVDVEKQVTILVHKAMIQGDWCLLLHLPFRLFADWCIVFAMHTASTTCI